MGKIKRYLDCHIPISTCNLRCSYCYIAQQERFFNRPPKVFHTLEEEKKAFSQERIGGPCLINLCAGGETLLYPDIVGLVRVILENGHYVMVVTNGLLTKKIEELLELEEGLRSRLFFKFSFHYLELKRLDLFEQYFDNIRKVRMAGASFTCELTPCDEEIEFIDDIKKKCMDNLGALPQVTIARSDIDPQQRIPHLSKLPFDKYIETWKVFDSELFNEKIKFFYEKRTEFCYAGDWSLFVNLESGGITPCNCGKRLGDFYDFSKPIKFRAIGNNCELAHCFNGHSWLSLGDIPEFEIKTYADLRNRKCLDGTEWLNSTIKEAFESKLVDSNVEYSRIKKIYTNVTYRYF